MKKNLKRKIPPPFVYFTTTHPQRVNRTLQ
jgi:hypothetical protein